MFVFDFETQAIQPRPDYPPEPVGLAFQTGRSGEPAYVHWGHADSTDGSAYPFAAQKLATGLSGPFVGHNVAFDLAVAHERMGLPLPPDGAHVNDTMFLAFLLDPYGELGLKPLAHRYLGMPPTERDEVRDWLVAQGIARKGAKNWGAHIAKAPAALVSPYAKGDATRTMQLFGKLWTKVSDLGMLEAYDRECDLVPMLLDNSARGVPLDGHRLRRDMGLFEEIADYTDQLIRQVWQDSFGTTPPGDLGNPTQLADALEEAGFGLSLTPTGKRSTSKAAIGGALGDNGVALLLEYRGAIQKTLTTYLRPWAGHGDALHCSWNQVRSYDDNGARTGRLSSSPNLQNITNRERYAALRERMVAAGVWRDWMQMPDLRGYITAPPGHVLFGVDYSQQELRVLAHYEDAVLAQAYRDDPNLDLHQFTADLILDKTRLDIGRRAAKTINFSKIYGAGRQKLAEQLGADLDTANRMVDAYESALPSVRQLQWELADIGRRGKYITTLGGRRYYAEPSKDGRSFEYKLLNYLIQGSSADQTKEAMRQWWRVIYGTDTRFLLTVHDELVGCCPIGQEKQAVRTLVEIMQDALPLDVPVIADAKIGATYGDLK
jgi:DNA polymerase-1